MILADATRTAGPGTPPADVARHFELAFYGALLRLRASLPGLDGPEVRDAFPFLGGYLDQLPRWARDTDPTGAWRRWCDEIDAWERAATGHLPIAGLRRAGGLDADAVAMLATAGLVDEDARFGPLLAALGGAHTGRPTGSFLASAPGTEDERRTARTALGVLRRRGILEALGPDDGADAPLRPAPALWTVLRGDPLARWPGLEHRPEAAAPPLEALVLDPDVARRAAAMPDLVRSGTVRAIVIRGPAAVGRATLLAAIARRLELGRLDLDRAALDPRLLPLAGSLAAALAAMPILAVEPAIGETVDLPDLDGWDGPVGIVLPRHGGVRGDLLDRAASIDLGMPSPRERRRHWAAALGDGDPAGVPAEATIDEIADRYRLGGGTIRRVAVMARASAAIDGRVGITLRDVREASRALRGRSLEVLAPRVEVAGSWQLLVADPDTTAELRLLEDRCRGRERMLEALPAPAGMRSPGVRALFTGPSGTGKTLAARILAAELEMDLHAVQLSSVVDKYIGETEKRIAAVFTQAAELDALLLLDEGDALLGKRTDISSSNDRYANLQTNHLLQQLEDHDGIVVVTTNAGERIDSAFLRRIDVVIEFRAPEPALRWAIWQRHLPAGHAVDEGALGEIAQRCALTGGQIRNAAVHAWLLAMRRSAGPVVPTTADVDAAVRREYRKVGAVCPLRGEGAGPAGP